MKNYLIDASLALEITLQFKQNTTEGLINMLSTSILEVASKGGFSTSLDIDFYDVEIAENIIHQLEINCFEATYSLDKEYKCMTINVDWSDAK